MFTKYCGNRTRSHFKTKICLKRKARWKEKVIVVKRKLIVEFCFSPFLKFLCSSLLNTSPQWNIKDKGNLQFHPGYEMNFPLEKHIGPISLLHEVFAMHVCYIDKSQVGLFSCSIVPISVLYEEIAMNVDVHCVL